MSQPFWPAYLDAERLKHAENLKLAITAEITYSNSISVSEHAVMLILNLVRNFAPSHKWVTEERGWNIADSAYRSFDLEGMDVGVLAAGRIGYAVLKRLEPFDVNLHYFDKNRLPYDVEKELNLTFHDSAQDLVRSVDVVSVHAPLSAETKGLFDEELLNSMRRGSYIVNTARGAIMDRDAVVRALESGQLAGYAGDVWYPQPPPENHPWRTMPHNAMTPHVSGTSIQAQARYAAGTREILEDYFAGHSIRDEYIIVDGGELAGTGAKSYKIG
ncbi:NAD-dependent formate dehydrogenase [Nesterenkonia ebinurensis]|uniref:NAD-dependent formate dehydrogenase n=1 Tax=Nesterenkonia ebinurensis TaxID=2608252 RepID=UPI001CC53B36|nr:NAD-dependent formate dehydrogenase [Nesterenkonia ebinurensis]